MCEKSYNNETGPSIGSAARNDRDERTLGYQRATDAQACNTKAQAIQVPVVVRDLLQRRDELRHQRSRIDEKLYTLNTVLGVFEG